MVGLPRGDAARSRRRTRELRRRPGDPDGDGVLPDARAADRGDSGGTPRGALASVGAGGPRQRSRGRAAGVRVAGQRDPAGRACRRDPLAGLGLPRVGPDTAGGRAGFRGPKTRKRRRGQPQPAVRRRECDVRDGRARRPPAASPLHGRRGLRAGRCRRGRYGAARRHRRFRRPFRGRPVRAGGRRRPLAPPWPIARPRRREPTACGPRPRPRPELVPRQRGPNGPLHRPGRGESGGPARFASSPRLRPRRRPRSHAPDPRW